MLGARYVIEAGLHEPNVESGDVISFLEVNLLTKMLIPTPFSASTIGKIEICLKD